MRPRLLDLFCGAGGAAMGYHRAGFEVVGVDIADQPNYPFHLPYKLDALEALDLLLNGGETSNPFGIYSLADFDAIHASPPCQSFSVSTNYRPENREKYPDLVAPTRDLLEATGLPYVIENVPGAPLKNYVTICGAGLGLTLRRHRLFETNFAVMGSPCGCGQLPWRAEFKHSTNRKRRRVVVLGEWRVPFELQKEAAGIDWMTLEELSESIPPAYTELIGSTLLAHVATKAAA